MLIFLSLLICCNSFFINKIRISQKNDYVREITCVRQALLSPEINQKMLKDYMNQNHEEDMIKYAAIWSDVGERMRKANAWTQGSFAVETANMLDIDSDGMDLSVTIMEKGFFGKVTRHTESVRVPFLKPVHSPNQLKIALLTMSLKAGLPASTGKMYQMPVGSYSGLPPNMKLNNVPHSTLVRSYFYRAASNAICDAVLDPGIPRRMKMTLLFPELNPEMDTYRVGTFLELVREMAFNLCRLDKRVRICIQGSMGEGIFTGLPLNLAGMRSIMERMDWNADGGADKGDLLGDAIVFGGVGPEFVDDKDDVFIVLAPQSMTAASIHEPLLEMVQAVNGRPICLINPQLQDRPSANNNMQVRGRAERIAFAESFKDIFYYRTLYPSRASYYPIVGALQKAGPLEPYVLYQKAGEDYLPVAAYENQPSGEQMSSMIQIQ